MFSERGVSEFGQTGSLVFSDLWRLEIQTLLALIGAYLYHSQCCSSGNCTIEHHAGQLIVAEDISYILNRTAVTVITFVNNKERCVQTPIFPITGDQETFTRALLRLSKRKVEIK